MRPDQRIVVALPLTELWCDTGPVEAQFVRELSRDDLRRLFRRQPTPLVVADVGYPLRWLAAAECFNFWKSEAASHLAEPGDRVSLSQFRDGYFYWAAEWSLGGEPVVVLEKHH